MTRSFATSEQTVAQSKQGSESGGPYQSSVASCDWTVTWQSNHMLRLLTLLLITSRRYRPLFVWMNVPARPWSAMADLPRDWLSLVIWIIQSTQIINVCTYFTLILEISFPHCHIAGTWGAGFSFKNWQTGEAPSRNATMSPSGRCWMKYAHLSYWSP